MGYENRTGHTGQRAVQREADGRLGAEHDLRSFIEAPLVHRRDRAVALVQTRQAGTRRVRVVFGSTSGQFGLERTIHTTEPDAWFTTTRAAVNDRGDFAVAHQLARRDDSRRLVLLERRPSGSFGKATLVDEQPVCRSRSCLTEVPADALAVSVGARGDLVVAWQAGTSIMARVRRAGRPMGPAIRLGAGYFVEDLRAAVSARGAVWVAWLSHARGVEGNGPLTVRAATRPAHAPRFGRTRALDHVADAQIFGDESLRLALDPRGAGFIAWSSPNARGGLPLVRLASADDRGRGMRVRTLSAAGDYALVEDLATSRRLGEALVVWRRITGEERTGSQVMAGLIAPDGRYRGQEVVSPSLRAGRPAGAFEPLTAKPIVVWPDTLQGAEVPAAQRQTVLAAALHG